MTQEIHGVISLGGTVIGSSLNQRGLKGEDGQDGQDGINGTDGVGIESIEKTSTSGLVDTYTITYTDGTTDTFTVTNGKDGQDENKIFWAIPNTTSYTELDEALDDGKTVLAYYNSRLYTLTYRNGNDFYFVSLVYDGDDTKAYGVRAYQNAGTQTSWSFNIGGAIQPKLVSGTSIKTINNTSLLGSGNIDIQGGGASAFIAEYGVTTYADVKDAYDENAIILCTVDDSGNTAICQLAYYDDANDAFYFAHPARDGFYLAIIASDDTWDDGYFSFASTDTATQLRDGLMTALDKQKLDGIASGAEVNVQSDWNQADNTADDFIKNKPAIPSKVSDLNNDSGFITTETDPTVPSWAKQASKPAYTASEVGALPDTTTIPTITDTYSGTSSNGMSGKAVKSAIDALDGSVSGSAGSDKTLTAFSQTDGKVSATFGNISITKSQVSDFPTIPSSAGDVGAIALPSSPSNGDFLVYNGSSWVAQSLSTWQGGSY